MICIWVSDFIGDKEFQWFSFKFSNYSGLLMVVMIVMVSRWWSYGWGGEEVMNEITTLYNYKYVDVCTFKFLMK